MGVSMQDIFGVSDTAAPAAPGTYGVAPRGYRLPDATRLGRVRLQVADLARSLDFYEHTLGLHVVGRARTDASLAAGVDGEVLVELEERPGVSGTGRGRLLGLYHFAILLPDRPSLGRFVRHLAERRVRAGAADHLVSEAFYLTDPDGLGIEVYADRARTSWRRMGRELMLATDPVDAAGLAAAAGNTPWTGMPAGTVIGHVHLHVGDLARADEFFAESLGFDRMTWRYPGALFLGAGGYHHHLGTNSWAGADARAPGEADARLLEWTIELPTVADVAAAARSLAGAGHQVEESPGALRVRDPWGTAIRVVALDA
ncbi:MAG: Glyoxalase/bleomycin resistance protein/dioxygenase [Gemmatimonadetes bacterium]|jgi:catechol 2,3-dioxygenase|nr:Glyoxalase/bleomycin resistance protein/dioxygenase [Gemmatimonadota bacterium]